MSDATNGRADGRRSRTPGRRRLIRTAIAVAATLVLSTAGAGAWFYHRLDSNITTFGSDGVATSRPPAPVPVTPGASLPVNVLLLGSDTRNDGNDDLGGGDIGVGHSDTAIVLHIYADHRHAVGVSIPRDALVTIPSCKLPNGQWTAPRATQMFNEAFTVGAFPKGNPACTQNTVEAMTGLRIDHTIVVDFKGVAAMTEAVNGVDACVPNDVDSHNIHLKKGPQKLSGQPAVDYLRARYGFGDNSDIGRMKRQQAFLSSMIKKIQSQGFSLTTLLPLADAATRSLTVDEGLGSAMKLVDFAQSMQNIKLADVTFVTTPWRFSGERVALVHPDVDTLWRLLREDRTLDGQSARLPDGSTPTASPAPSATAPATPGPELAATPIVLVNGTRTSGLASSASAALKAGGYQNVSLGPMGGSRLTTEIAYAPEAEAAAQQLAPLFPGARLLADADTDGVVITLGHDYQPGPAADATSASRSERRAQGPAGSAGPSGAATPSGIPSGITDNTRAADTDPCANLTFG
ncbi:LCP family protein [Kitasatospora sp. NPDC050543]|uniref:LCP family protein n=1 Tax=Kitasatospora sp. NPDC050543 TaxID=3364054 RepID=UPI00378D2A31